MFEDVPIPDDSDFDLPPIPKYLVIDFSICSGMDTSAVSVFGEVIDLCEQNNCKAIFAGMSRNLKEMMKFGGVIESKKKKHVFISTNLESALGNAEDSLLSRFAQFRKIEYIKHHKQNTSPSHGFFSALREIDDQVGLVSKYIFSSSFLFDKFKVKKCFYVLPKLSMGQSSKPVSGVFKALQSL